MIGPDDIGRRVKDSAGRIGILRAVDLEWEDPAELPSARRKQATAFMGPEGGGREWLVPADTVRPVRESPHLPR